MTKMRVMLVNPPLSGTSGGNGANPVYDNLFYNSPPLGLCYIAAVLERRGVQVGIIDAALERLTVEGTARRIAGFAPRVVGLTATTFSFSGAAALARAVKRSDAGMFTVIGGPHVSAAPEHALACGWFDAGVIGEGERTFAELVSRLEAGEPFEDVDGLVFLKGGQPVRTRPREFIEDLDELPFPARHLVPLDRYAPQPNDERERPKISMITSRACPYDCIFCDKSVFGKRYRSFSPGYIVDEMEHLVSRYGARDIAFIDSLFTVSEERVRAVCDEILRRGVRVTWTCTVRANVIKGREVFDLMKRAGCWRVRIGVESGSPEVLRFIRKNTTLDQVRSVARWADRAGLQPKGFFMIGHLNDTRRTIEDTMRFARSLPLKDITVQINTPLPFTPQHSMYREHGRLLAEDFSEFSLWNVAFVPNGLTAEDLERYFTRFYRSFYLRPSVVLRHLAAIRSAADVLRYLRSLRLVVYLFFGALRGKRPRAGGGTDDG